MPNQIPEAVMEAAHARMRGNPLRIDAALHAAYPLLRNHFLQGFREGLLSKEALQAAGANIHAPSDLIAERSARLAIEAALDSLWGDS